MTIILLHLVNSSGCVLDTRSLTVAEGGDLEGEIAKAMMAVIGKDWVMNPGDCIRVEEYNG